MDGGPSEKTFESPGQQNEGAQMSNELESDSAMVMNLEGFGGPRWCWLRRDRDSDRAAKFDIPAVRIMFQVTQIVRFLLERGLRFRNLGFWGHDLM
jgi:hypothetical protein